MSDTINDGGPAFPDSGQADYTGGMTLRDWFAGQALAGMDANNYASPKIMALTAIMVAEAMLVARQGGAK